MATIYDIAERSGFAPATVSKALNNYPGVNEQSRQKIVEIARELGFQPNSAARSLRTAKSYSLGVVFSLDGKVGVNQILIMNVLNAFQTYVGSKGYDIVLLTKTETEKGKTYLSHIEKRNVDGILIFANYYYPEIKEIMSLSLPIVGFDYIGTEICGVTSDSYEQYFALTEAFINKGHKNIVFFCGNKNIITNERIRGFKDALEKNNIAFKDSMLLETGYYNVEQNRKATLEVMKRNNPPTAILYPDDFSSLGGFAALEELNLSVPNDVSVAGFDGIEIGRTTYPSLTTVKQNTEEIGVQLAKTLIHAINDSQSSKIIRVVKSELIVTPSLGTPKK